MKVLKFGGSSIGDVERIKNVIEVLKKYYIDKGENFAVVFSAFEGVTDMLVSMSNKAVKKDEFYQEQFTALRTRHLTTINALIPKTRNKKIITDTEMLLDELKNLLHGVFLVGEITAKTQDYIMSFGERLSCSIIACLLNDKKIAAQFLDSRQLIKTDDCFGSAKVDFEETYRNIKKYFKSVEGIAVVTGFIASNKANQTTTLGRGGSDYTASIFGAALKAKEIIIWTDVDGILTADPRKVKSAFSLKAVTYEEAMELSHFGAKVIHPPTILPALHNKVKIRIKNTFNPEFKGTVIVEREAHIAFNVKGISSIDAVTMLTIRGGGMVGVAGTASRLLSALARNNISVILISQGSSEHTITLAVLPEYGEDAKKYIEEEFKYELREGEIKDVIKEDNLSVLAVVGDDLKKTPGIFGKIFRALGKNGVNCHTVAQGSSDLNTSIVICKDDLVKALNVLHDDLFLSKFKTINLFMVGPGLVGGTLLDLIGRRLKYLKDELNIRVKLVALANSKKMIFDAEGLNIAEWNEVLETSLEKMNSKKYIQKMKKMNLSNTIFVDCTATDLMVPHYKEILESSISIVTPNKIANSKPYNEYLEIHSAAKNNNVQFRYGTNVGAALPIINTLKDLVANGDEVLKIEGVLSGTLSYIFNSLKDEDSFSQIVNRARKMGYTEPDPREDLNGLDMVRKLLILIRETSIPFELENIEVENLIPERLRNIKSSESFLEKLGKYDSDFMARKNDAAQKGNVLAYVATYEDGKAKVGVEELDENHPFYNLRGNDNIVAFTTKNYRDKPLMIRGPGAGAEVTASGVFTDILRITNYLSN